MLLNFWNGIQRRTPFQFSKYGKQRWQSIDDRKYFIARYRPLRGRQTRIRSRVRETRLRGSLARLSADSPARIQPPRLHERNGRNLSVSRAARRKSADVTRALSIVITTCPSIHLIPRFSPADRSSSREPSHPPFRPSVTFNPRPPLFAWFSVTTRV